MFFKSLELHGFKSFPDKINISFGKGITAIVGPNGSGKSNISDAIRWVLGEQSSKTLRGGKMEDVIFDGTKIRKPMGFASGSIVMDNSDKSLNIDYEEVTVTRKYYRSGESEYYINKNQVRLKDIYELFMDTGIGKDGYSVIGQGKIAEILSVKSDDRRQIFEEAAGISKYRYSKNQAVKNLKDTQDNLIRINDILKELTIRRDELKRQSEKAKKYLEFRERKREIEISLWIEQIDKSKNELEKIQADYKIAKDMLVESNRDIEFFDKKAEEYMSLMQIETVEIDKSRQKISQFEISSNELKNKIEIMRNDIEHNLQNIEKIKGYIETFDENENKINSDIKQNEYKKKEIEKNILIINDSIKTLDIQLKSIIKSSAEFNIQLSSAQEKLSESTAFYTDKKIEKTLIESKIANNSENIKSLMFDIENKNNKLLELKNEFDEICKEKKENEIKLQSLSNIIDGYKLKIEKRNEKFEKMNDDYSKLSGEYLQKKQKLQLLSDMQKHFEGFNHAVKTVMTRKKQGLLSGICAPVSMLIKTSDEYSLAIETALGAAAQNIVTNTENDAKQAMLHLKSTNSGRATFLPKTSVKPSLYNFDKSKMAGFIGVASELVTYDKDYINIINNILGRIIIVDHIDNAIRTAKNNSYKFKVVTLDGQVINAGGSMTGGSAVKSAGFLTRTNEIENLNNDVIELQQKCKELSDEISLFKEENSKLYALYNASVAEQTEIKSCLVKTDSEYNAKLSHIDALKLSLERNIMQKEELNRNHDEFSKLREDNQLALRNAEENIEKINNDIEKIVGENKDILDKQNLLSEKIADYKMQILSFEKDKENIIIETARLEEQKKQGKNEILQRKNEINSYEKLNVQINQNINQVQSEYDKCIENSEKINNEIQIQIQKRDEYEKKSLEFRRQNKEKIADHENLIRENERFENKLNNMQNQYDIIVSKLWDEYELTLTSARSIKIEIKSVADANNAINSIKRKMKELGDVNISAIEEFKTVDERYQLLSSQTEDLEKSKAGLESLIKQLTDSMEAIFSSQFKIINKNFGEIFKELFGGGSASLKLSDSNDILNSDIDFDIQPPGKIIKNIMSLSGGEQAFIAIALYFAILKVRPTPFCIVDEVEAALDDVNVNKFASYLRRLTEKTQFIVITHRRGTMEEADVLYGVTMQEKGISKMLTINVNEAQRKFKIK